MKRSMQSGQAIVEGLVVMGVLSSLWLGVAWLGRLQDVALQVGHTSRHQAFALSHQGLALDKQALERLPGQSWQTRRGEAFLDAEVMDSSLAFDGREPSIRLGEAAPAAVAMREDLLLGERGVWVVSAHRRTVGEKQAGSGLQSFDRLELGINRHTAIMRGTGAAVSDDATQVRLAQAGSVWAAQAGRSIALGEQVSGRMQAVDAAWGRAAFSSDWLGPWTGWVPAHHLSTEGMP